MEDKLILKKRQALIGNNKRALINACNDLANFYYKQNRYGAALDEFKMEADINKELGFHMERGTCNRMIGEMYMHLAEFDKALEYMRYYLDAAVKSENLVEEQRAEGAIGRIYLLQGQTTNDDKEAAVSLHAAQAAFLRSFKVCLNLNSKVNTHEQMDMQARLILNIGVVQDHLGNLERSLEYTNKALQLCNVYRLYEVMHSCYISQALLYKNKKKDYLKALCCLNKALEAANHLKNKVVKTCETLSEKAETLCKMSDYQSAKRVLVKAWKMKTPDQKEREEIEDNLRAVAKMCHTEKLLADTADHARLKELYETLGDGACYLSDYGGAVEYYLKMLDHAQLAGDCDKAPIYISLYKTCKDLGSYNVALHYYEKEYELIKNDPRETFSTMHDMAETLFLAKKPYSQIEMACERARTAAQQLQEPKYETRALKSLLKYQKEYGETDKLVQTQDALKELGYDNFDNLENSEEEQGPEYTPFGKDFSLVDLTDDEETSFKPKRRRRVKLYKVKRNKTGETELHEAINTGNKLLVDKLVAKGHPVNIPDKAGWLPLHKACLDGHIGIVKVLIDSGADINERRGNQCNGTTPLCDAATKGHLEIMELLLEKGASPFLKTNSDVTPLNILQKWRKETTLSEDQETLYNNICNKIQSLRDETDSNKSKRPVKSVDEFASRSNTLIMNGRNGKLNSPASASSSGNGKKFHKKINERIKFSSDSDDSERGISEKHSENESEDTEDEDEVDVKMEVDDNMFAVDEPDIKIEFNKRKRKLDEHNVRPNMSTTETISNNTVERKSSTSNDTSNNRIDNEDDLLSNNVSASNSRRTINQGLTPTRAVSRRSSVDSFHSNIHSNDGLSENVSPNPMLSMNMTQPINIVQSTSNGIIQKQIFPPPAVKVHFEGKILLITLKIDTIDDLTISWLIEQVKNRYHKLTGVVPEAKFSLMTLDEAIFSDDDPLSLVVSVPELKTYMH